jgi:hypothetical protein
MKRLLILTILLCAFSFARKEDDPLFESNTSSKPEFKIINNNQDANSSSLILEKTSINPADNDSIGEIIIRGNNSSGKRKNFSTIKTIATDITKDSEDSSITIKTFKAGTETDSIVISSTGTNFDGIVSADSFTGSFPNNIVTDNYGSAVTLTDGLSVSGNIASNAFIQGSSFVGSSFNGGGYYGTVGLFSGAVTADSVYVSGIISGTCQTLKMHRTTELTSPTIDAWTNCDEFSIIENETIGTVISANISTGAVTVSKSGLYNFGGCVHFQNDSGGEKRPLVASRIFINNTDEARCSQRDWNGTVKNGGQGALSYNGTVYLESNDYIKLQYYVDDNTIDFISDSVFQNPVAWTLWLTYCGHN